MTRVPILDHGYIELIDSMGDDLAIVDAARTSFDQGEEAVLHRISCGSVSPQDSDCNCYGTDPIDHDYLSKRDAGLINFLMKHKHGTPFEMVSFKFAVKAPIFIFREWHRHRIASINEMSGRYVELPREFYVPARDDIREQKGKAGSYTYERIEDDGKARAVHDGITNSSNRSFDTYDAMLADGIAKEVARLVLPVNTYSKMVWKTNLRAALNFVNLRNAPGAQYEIRVYAEAMEKMLEGVVPVAMASFNDNGRQVP